MKTHLLLSLGLTLVAWGVFSQEEVPAHGPGELSVYNWIAYIPDDVLSDFQKETGIHLNYQEYDSNETLVAAVTAGKEVDVAFPSLEFVPLMVDRGLLAPLDWSLIPHQVSIDLPIRESVSSFDPGFLYAVPFNLGCVTLVYWKDQVSPQEMGYGILADRRYQGKTAGISDPREVFGAALHSLGYSGNTTDPVEIQVAAGVVQRWKARALAFDFDTSSQLFIQKKAAVVLAYPENIMAQIGESDLPRVGIFFPREGGMKYLDCMVILKNAKHLTNAYRFIDFILRPDILARIADAYGYPGISTQANALRKVQPYYLAEQLAPYEYRRSVGSAADLYTQMWDSQPSRP